MKPLWGFTLLIVLVFLQIFALLTLNSLSQTSMLTRANFHQYQTDNLLRLAENTLSELEKKSASNCFIKPLPAATLATLSLSWWQTHACIKILENTIFYYIWEFLGSDQCCVMQQKMVVAQFYRLSLFVVQQRTELLLQSMIALPSSEKPICKIKPHFLLPGRQMYREVK